MLRRLNTCAVLRTAPLAALSASQTVSYRPILLPSPSCRPAAVSAAASGSALCLSARFISSGPLPPRLMRAAGSIRPQNSPMNFSGATGGEGSTAESLTPFVRQHLVRVYTLLGAGCVVAGGGSFLMFATPLGKAIPFWFPMVAGFVPLLWLSFKPPQNPTLKLALFFSFTALEGMAIAPIVMMSMAKGVLGTAIVLTAAVFCGFSAAAYLAPRASMLALQGPLFGLLMGMVAISVLNLFYPTAFAHSIILYGGLALFSLFVAVDTQAMIERARCGAGDHVQDAMQMFISVVNIFVRIAQILGSMDR